MCNFLYTGGLERDPSDVSRQIARARPPGDLERRVLRVGDRRGLSRWRQSIYANHRERERPSQLHTQRLREHRPGHHLHPNSLGTFSTSKQLSLFVHWWKWKFISFIELTNCIIGYGDPAQQDTSSRCARNLAEYRAAKPGQSGPKPPLRCLQSTVRPHSKVRPEDWGPAARNHW